MRDCKEIKDRLIEFIEGNLEDSQEKDFRKHLDECQECRALFNRFEAVYNSADESEEIELSPDFMNRLEERVEKYEDEKVSLSEIWEYFSGKARPAIASIALIGAIIAGYFLGSGVAVRDYATADTDDVTLTEYYGMDYFDLSTDLAVPEIYYEITSEEGQNE
ncbi:MAG: zf-HC2 domain-containing protein [candidate division Zixibacteria bacterium]|nr:zf-HC2 domain-containing protein [candidate division Zixibacteria bacterium]NIR63759.1 zf-HC2 domain-containing protein [candidate division Zixibacteria bacterium]NIS15010.1 zf-HC2 domain-containing protein [candidate division Zixibacteria bacterium]NIS45719.1 zf-HC2 domain-containing protein [candidate division Zixibacteria bacterium]NIT51267.1 zf-HC2 domain-containing protein [candidate division Zixibacteria bacterium]